MKYKILLLTVFFPFFYSCRPLTSAKLNVDDGSSQAADKDARRQFPTNPAPDPAPLPQPAWHWSAFEGAFAEGVEIDLTSPWTQWVPGLADNQGWLRTKVVGWWGEIRLKWKSPLQMDINRKGHVAVLWRAENASEDQPLRWNLVGPEGAYCGPAFEAVAPLSDQWSPLDIPWGTALGDGPSLQCPEIWGLEVQSWGASGGQVSVSRLDFRLDAVTPAPLVTPPPLETVPPSEPTLTPVPPMTPSAPPSASPSPKPSPRPTPRPTVRPTPSPTPSGTPTARPSQTPTPLPPPSPDGATLWVDPRQDRPLLPVGSPLPGSRALDVLWPSRARVIHPAVYGVNFHSLQNSWVSPAWGSDKLVRSFRMGGNNWSTWNWKSNWGDGGSDGSRSNWSTCRIMARPDRPASCDTPGWPVLAAKQQLQDLGLQKIPLIVTLPLMGFVATSAPSVNLRLNNGAPLWTPHPEWQAELVEWLGAHTDGSNLWVSLDNEPEGWNSTHGEPKATYSDITNKGLAAARLLKDKIPGVTVVGPALMSYDGLISGGGHMAPTQDVGWATLGNFTEHYARAFREASLDGKRLLDVFDFHTYPQAKNRPSSFDCNPTLTPESTKALLQEPRNLWDGTWNDTSWDSRLWGPKALLVRTRTSLENAWPGTRIGVTEWNLGDSKGVAGMLAHADFLGALGREGASLGNYWQLCDADVGVQAAFRAFLNFDGKGSAFGSVSLPVEGAVAEREGAWAATDTDTERVTVLVINKTDSVQKYSLRFRGPTRLGRLRAWRSDGLQWIPWAVSTQEGVVPLELPPLSMALVEGGI